MDKVSYTLVVPHMTTRRDEQGLTRRDWIKADAALRTVHAGCIRVSTLADAGALEQALVCGSVEIVEALLPAAVALDADLDTSENHLLAALEVDTKLDDIAVVDGIWATLDART